MLKSMPVEKRTMSVVKKPTPFMKRVMLFLPVILVVIPLVASVLTVPSDAAAYLGASSWANPSISTTTVSCRRITG